MHWHKIYDIGSAIVLSSSVLYAALPSWESFEDWPRFQERYKFVMIFVVKLASLNVRSMLRPDIQATANAGGTATK